MSSTTEKSARMAATPSTDGPSVTFTSPTPPPAGSLALSRFRLKRKRGRHAILVGVLPSDFAPTNPTALPPKMVSVEVAEQDCTLFQAIALVRTHNAEQLAAGIPDRLWALLAFQPKGGAE